MMFNYLKYIPLVFLTIYVGFIKTEDVFKAGVHYEILDKPTPTSDINKIEVVELFWLSCSHCYSLEFYINDWKKSLPGDVNFWKSHVTWNATAKIHARVYYIALALGIEEEAMAAAFHSIHQERKFLTGETELEYFFKGFGVKREKYNSIRNSFGIENSLNQANKRMRQWSVSAVPNLIVNGKYKVSPNRETGINQLLKIVDFLIEKERKVLTRSN